MLKSFSLHLGFILAHLFYIGASWLHHPQSPSICSSGITSSTSFRGWCTVAGNLVSCVSRVDVDLHISPPVSYNINSSVDMRFGVDFGPGLGVTAFGWFYNNGEYSGLKEFIYEGAVQKDPCFDTSPGKAPPSSVCWQMGQFSYDNGTREVRLCPVIEVKVHCPLSPKVSGVSSNDVNLGPFGVGPCFVAHAEPFDNP